MARKKETGVLCGIFLWVFVNGPGLDQVLCFGRSLKLPLFHRRFRCVKDAGVGSADSSISPLFMSSSW